MLATAPRVQRTGGSFVSTGTAPTLAALCELVEEFGLVHFHTLNVQVRVPWPAFRTPTHAGCADRGGRGRTFARWCTTWQDKQSVHALQRTIDKANGYIYGISDESKDAYMMSSGPVSVDPPPYVAASLRLRPPPAPTRSPRGVRRRRGARAIASPSHADLLVREHYDEERIRDQTG